MLLYYFTLFFIYVLAYLPFGVLYLFSRFVYVIVYYVLHYRESVVEKNLCNAFPEKSKQELQEIKKKFYRYLADLTLEIFKSFKVSRAQIKKRCTFSSDTQQLIDRLYAEKKSILYAMGHFGNWEWARLSTCVHAEHHFFVIYQRLTNSFFDRFFKRLRSRWGSVPIEKGEVLRAMFRSQDKLSATAFIADQATPPKHAYWTNFLNQDTTVDWGLEKIARKFNYPVIFVSVRRKKRGYYEIYTELISYSPREEEEGQILEQYTRKLEQEIVQQPEVWLWTHRRWKYKKGDAL